MTADIHALGLLGMPAFTIMLLLWQGQLEGWYKRIVPGLILGFVAMTVVIVIYGGCKCGAGNNPKMPGYMAALCITMVVTFGGNSLLRYGTTLLFTFVAYALSNQFQQLALNDPGFTGETIGLVVNGEYPSDAEFPPRPGKTATSLWHTPLTGLYAVHRTAPIPLTSQSRQPDASSSDREDDREGSG